MAVEPSLPWLGLMASDFAPTMFLNAAAVWHSAIEDLSAHASACRYPLAARRAAVRQDAISFCDRFGAEAHRLGWTADELFAVRPGHGTLRMDYCGMFMVVSESAMAVEAQRIVFEPLTGYRSKVCQQWCISVWKFARKGVGR